MAGDWKGPNWLLLLPQSRAHLASGGQTHIQHAYNVLVHHMHVCVFTCWTRALAATHACWVNTAIALPTLTPHQPGPH